MSKALEAAHEAGVEAFKVRFSADCSAVDALTDYRDALLAHLAEDDELRDRIKQVVAEGLYYGLPQVDPKLVSETLAGDIADVIVRTLAGKE